MSMTDSEERAVRLFGVRESPGSGGLLLPETFGRILEMLLAGPQPGDVLYKVIRETLSYKGERILEIYGSWDSFCQDILLILRDGGLVTEDEEHWSATPKVIPDTQLTVLRDHASRNRRVRVIIHDSKGRERKEAVAEAWRRANELTRFLEERRELSPVLARTRDKAAGIALILQNAINDPEPGRKTRSGTERPPLTPSLAAWYRNWASATGWHTLSQARAAWNKEFPAAPLPWGRTSGLRAEVVRLIDAGLMEKSPVKVANNDGRKNTFEYRWTGE
jgi:hypothetical protein